MSGQEDKPRLSVDHRIAELERKLHEQKMQGEMDRHEAIEAARMTHPEIKRKRRGLLVFAISGALVLLGVVFYFMFREPPAEQRAADEEEWSLPPPEKLPDAPELPDIEKLKREQQQKARTGQRAKKKEVDLLEGIDD